MVTKLKFTNLSNEARLEKLAAMPDDEIDYSDVPDMSTANNWKKLYSKVIRTSAITDEIMFDALAKAAEENN